MSLRSVTICAVIVLAAIGCLVILLLPDDHTRECLATQVGPATTNPSPISSGKSLALPIEPNASDLGVPTLAPKTSPVQSSDRAGIEASVSRWLGMQSHSGTSAVRRATSAEMVFPFVQRSVSEDSLVVSEIDIPHFVFSSGESAYTNQRLRNVACIFDEDRGQVVQVVIADPDAGILPGEMQIKEAEARYMWANERYLGLPDAPPSVSLSDILRKLPEVSMADVRNCRRITASYLVSAENGVRDPMTVWVVHCQGFPAYPSLSPDHGKGEPPSERTFLRFLFDRNGRFLQADNQPLVTGPQTNDAAQ